MSPNLMNITGSVILRGAGTHKTKLYFALPLVDSPFPTVPPEERSAGTPDRISFGPGYINFIGNETRNIGTVLAAVTKNAARGDKLVHVNSTQGIRAGDWVRITASDPGTLGGKHSGDTQVTLDTSWYANCSARAELVGEGALTAIWANVEKWKCSSR